MTKPDFYGNIYYEGVMGLYYTEEEAKEEAWRNEEYFPLYSEDTVKNLENELLKYKKYFAENVMIPNEEYSEICEKLRKAGHVL